MLYKKYFCSYIYQMKKIVFLFIISFCFSCSDGDFKVPAFEFTDTLNQCGDFILYKTNTKKTEAFILTIPSTSFKTTEKEETYTVKLSISTFVTYRAFDAAFENSYFCNNIPPTKPNVINELTANNGEIKIVTTKTSDTNSKTSTYKHAITLIDLVLKNADGENKITFKEYDFGSFTTKKS